MSVNCVVRRFPFLLVDGRVVNESFGLLCLSVACVVQGPQLCPKLNSAPCRNGAVKAQANLCTESTAHRPCGEREGIQGE